MSELEEVVRRALERAPKWIRADLLKDGQELRRAEETLAAMIAIALTDVWAARNGMAVELRPAKALPDDVARRDQT